MTVITLTESTFVIKSISLRHFIDESGNPWFVAKDVCDYLDIDNVSQACSRLFDGYVRISEVDTGGGSRGQNVVNEYGLSQLIFQSRKPEAIAFQRWVFEKVLPQIRRYGEYRLPGRKPVSRQNRQPFLDVIRSRKVSLARAVDAMNELPLEGVGPIRSTNVGNEAYGRCRVSYELATRASAWLQVPIDELFNTAVLAPRTSR